MPKVEPFEIHHSHYDAWFERHTAAYHSELLAVRALTPWQGLGVSIGVGTGRFASPMGIQIGIDPARKVLNYASKRDISTVRAIAEALPFRGESFDYVLSVTTICFVDDVTAMFSEAYRILKPGGQIVIGFIDRTSKLGQHYLAHKAENIFYQEATFYSANEVDQLLSNTGFIDSIWVQTLTKTLEKSFDIEPIRAGYGQGAFVVVKAYRPSGAKA